MEEFHRLSQLEGVQQSPNRYARAGEHHSTGMHLGAAREHARQSHQEPALMRDGVSMKISHVANL